MDFENIVNRIKGFAGEANKSLRSAAAKTAQAAVDGWEGILPKEGVAPSQPVPEANRIAPLQGQVVQPSGPQINVDSKGFARQEGQSLRNTALPPRNSPEANAFRASQAAYTPPGPNPATPTTPTPTEPVVTTKPSKPGLMARGLGGLARVAGPVAATTGVLAGSYDAIKNGPSDMDRTIGEEVIGETKPDDQIGEFLKSNVGAVSSAGRRIGNAMSFGFGLGDKAVGGLRDIIKGQPLGTTQFPDNAKPAAQPLYDGNAVNGPHTRGEIGEQTNGLRASNAGDIKTNQGPMSPEALMQGNAVPDEGYGAFSTNGKTQGLRPKTNGFNTNEIMIKNGMGPYAAPAQPQRTDLSHLQEMSKRGPAGAMAALAAYGGVSKLAQNATQNGLRRDAVTSNAQLKLAEMARNDYWKNNEDARATRNELRADREFANKTGNDTQKDNEAEILNRARDTTPVTEPGLLKDRNGQAYKDSIEKNAAKLKSDYEYSLQTEGKSLKTASQRDIQKLHIADELQNKVLASREGWRKQFGDYYGTNRFNSRNKNDFLPVSVEASPMPGTKWLILRSGERIPVHEAAGGGFNWTKPNDPVDRQLTDAILKADSLNKEKK